MLPLIINLALTGMVPHYKDNPNVPTTIDEIVSDVQKGFEAGARIFHIHARDENGDPTYRKEVFCEILKEIKKTTPEAVICVSTSGRVHTRFEERSDVLNLTGDIKPDLASLTLGSMNFPKQASVNDPAMISRLAACMKERLIIPEIEIFDFGMLDYAHYLIDKKILNPPFVFVFLLGSLGTLSAIPLNLSLLVERLPKESLWSAAGIGRFQFPMNMLGVIMGGGVRTGLEDNLYMDDEKIDLATNERLIKRITECAKILNRPIATPSYVREVLNINRSKNI